MKNVKHLIILMSLAAIGASARPQQGGGEKGPQNGGGFVERLDKDKDGKISSAEFDGPEDAFSHLDRNGDGYISEEEAPKGPPPRNRE